MSRPGEWSMWGENGGIFFEKAGGFGEKVFFGGILVGKLKS